MTWREYHEATKHSTESLRRNGQPLEWANMPDPFRHYEGVPVLDLPADPPSPQVPTLELLQGAMGTSAAKCGPVFLSQLLYYSAAISATKKVPAADYQYALRVNPSSGNLHPTEFHFATRGLNGWPDGLYHYRASSHMAGQRALGDYVARLGGEADTAIVFVLTSIAWREAWKYRERAYRYCLHDIGHAWEALVLSARAAGCTSFAVGHFADDEIASLCGLNEDEWPLLMLRLRGSAIPLESRGGEGNQVAKVLVRRDRQPSLRGAHPLPADRRYPFGDQVHNLPQRSPVRSCRVRDRGDSIACSGGCHRPFGPPFWRGGPEAALGAELHRAAVDLAG
jgi:SagB-type dehydrogenase family enzyme